MHGRWSTTKTMKMQPRIPPLRFAPVGMTVIGDAQTKSGPGLKPRPGDVRSQVSESRPGASCFWLEDELAAELDPARRVAARNLAKRAIVDRAVNVGEAFVVEGVEELAAELERNPFDDLHVLDGCEIPVVEPG